VPTVACVFTPKTSKPPWSFDLDDIRKDSENTWSNFVRGVSKFLEADGHRLCGADIAFGGDVPLGAGLSSSAAVEVGATRFGTSCWAWDSILSTWSSFRAVRKTNLWACPAGSWTNLFRRSAAAIMRCFLDCRDLTYRHVPLRGDVKIVVCNSGVKRALAQSEYEVRLKQCQGAVAKLAATGRAVKSLRDVQLADLDAARDSMTTCSGAVPTMWSRKTSALSRPSRFLKRATWSGSVN